MMTPIPNFSDREPGQAEAELFQLWLETAFFKASQTKETRTGLHASTVLCAEEEWCPRRWVLNNVVPEEAEAVTAKPWDGKRENTFENGWAIHIKWQRFFKKLGIVKMSRLLNGIPDPKAPEQPELDLTHYDPVRDLYFSPDAIIVWAGQGYVVEIKGYNDLEYKRLVARSDTPDVAARQCNLYLHLLGMKRGFILVENKNTGAFHVWPVTYNQELAQPYAQRALDVRARTTIAREHRRLPVRTCQSKFDARAQSCPMKSFCFNHCSERNFL